MAVVLSEELTTLATSKTETSPAGELAGLEHQNVEDSLSPGVR